MKRILLLLFTPLILSSCGSSESTSSADSLPTEFAVSKLNIEGAKSLFMAKSLTSTSSSSTFRAASDSENAKDKLHVLRPDNTIEPVSFEDADGNDSDAIEVTDVNSVGSDYVTVSIKYRKKVAICTKNNITITIAEPALKAHLANGATLGPCSGDSDTSTDEYEEEQILTDKTDGKVYDLSDYDLTNSQIHKEFIYAFSKSESETLFKIDFENEQATAVNNPDFLPLAKTIDNDCDGIFCIISLTLDLIYLNTFGTSVGLSSATGHNFVIDENDSVIAWEAFSETPGDGTQQFIPGDGSAPTEYGNDAITFGSLVGGSDHRYTSYIKSPSGKLYAYRWEAKQDMSQHTTVLQKISFDLDTAARQTSNENIASSGWILPHNDSFAISDLPRYVPYTEGFAKVITDDDGDLVASFTSYDTIGDEYLVNTEGVNENRYTKIGAVSGKYYYWQKDDTIYRIKFEEDAEVEEILTDSNIIKWTVSDDTLIYNKYYSGTSVGTYRKVGTSDAELIAQSDMEIRKIIVLEE